MSTPTAPADPTKPYKAVVALLIPAVLAALNAIINANVDGTLLPQWGALLVTAVATALGVYVTPNPIKGVRRTGL